ncbi:DSBA-like thioredoxin domain-containing protein [Xylaria bambusicola]|uniref:DSBA-like thioredoxin domain-containing protein n=1 Tax=Xylaria bambusicola TaxID=326684 RepID=UPI002008D1AC|nr:DSBA-like thioredoxin domain-containing protein [Xylaria bambusicola]KAI0516964.1 DSBA-like thioredoxin domain-containing protein [Xylaria bambusicola]
MTNFNIKIVSDTVCPWCYVGKRRLDRAIELYRKTYPAGQNDTFTITWAPFYLDPTSPAVGIPVKERMAQKFGSDRLEMIHHRLTTVGQEEGINFAFAGRIGNTRDSHRLIQLGKTKGNDVENRVVAELFKSYFEGEGDITSHATLVAAGEKAGLTTSEVKEWLETGKGGAEVDKEVQEAYTDGISGVPNFTIQGAHNIGGAQDPEVFLATFARIKESSK